MLRRWLLGIAVVLLAGIVVVFAMPNTRQALLTRWHGEPYFHGKRASDWFEATTDPRDQGGMIQARRALLDGGPDAVPVLVWMYMVQRGGVYGNWIREIGEPAIPPLRDMVLHHGSPLQGEHLTGDAALRVAAVDCLARFGKPAHPALREAMGSRFVEVRGRSVRVLASRPFTTSPDTHAEVVQTLRDLLQDPAVLPWMRANAAHDLGSLLATMRANPEIMMSDFDAALNDLEAAQNDPHEAVREAARAAVERVNDAAER